MEFEAVLQGFAQLHKQMGPVLDSGTLIFARLLSFIFFAPVFNRKDVAFPVKLSLALFLTVLFLGILSPADKAAMAHSYGLGWLLLQIVTNVLIGALLGFIASTLLLMINAAGSLVTSQVGLSSAMLFDPSSRQQVMILDSLFGFIGTILFIKLGGFYWLILAIKKSFVVFPLYQINPQLPAKIQFEYISMLCGNVMEIAVLITSPVLLVTMLVDIMLGVVNRTAQQIPVFQLSFGLKPSIGSIILLLTLTIFINEATNYFEQFSGIF